MLRASILWAQSVAMTATWLACKLEEEPRHSRHLLAVFHRLQRRRLKEPLKVLDYYSKVHSHSSVYQKEIAVTS